MRKIAIILGITSSYLLFSQNRTDVVDVAIDGKIETQEEKELQNYMLIYLRQFFDNKYEKERRLCFSNLTDGPADVIRQQQR